MATRKPQTLGDYVAIAISPALIIAMVGSLVFFLLEVFYQGQYEGRMQWILFFFVFGAVLIARISMETAIAERAPLYGLALGAVVWLGLLRFATFPEGSRMADFAWLINIFLIAVIWWSVHRLTWDCTYIDDDVEASGEGLLQAAGLEQSAQKQENPEASAKPRAAGWFERYRRFRERQRKKPQNPGVWVVYFSLAALPIFGLGQSLIPAQEEERRRYVFWLMGVYVASGLGLLLTTCFLGLRRYLRQRKLEMPATVTGLWLAMGGGMVLALLVLGAFLPRPNAEYPLVSVKNVLGSKERDASKYAAKGGDKGRGDGGGGNAKGNNAQNNSGGKGGQDPGGKGQGSPQGKSSDGQKSDSSGNQSGNQGGNKSSSQGNQGQGNQGQGQQNQGQQNKGDSANSEKKDSQTDSANKPGSGKKDTADITEGKFLSTFSSTLATLGNIVKWILFGLLALVLVFFLFRAALKYLANFTDWAGRLLAWLQSLFGGWTVRRAEAEAQIDEEAAAVVTQRPFSSYRNPFLSSKRQSPEELLKYSFEALEAFARDAGQARQPEETPLEFCHRLGAEFPPLEADLRRLAHWYTKAAYDRGRLAKACLDDLRRFWKQLERTAATPLSA